MEEMVKISGYFWSDPVSFINDPVSYKNDWFLF